MPKEGYGQHRGHQAQEEASIHEMDTIFGGPYVSGEARNAQRNYARETKHTLLMSYTVDISSKTNQVPTIVFT